MASFYEFILYVEYNEEVEKKTKSLINMTNNLYRVKQWTDLDTKDENVKMREIIFESSYNIYDQIIEKFKDEKINKLYDILNDEKVSKTLIFDDTHHNVERLNDELRSRGFDSEAIHGGKSQAQRQRALKKFKDSNVKVLVATDVAARGIDVSDITHVVNFSLPQTYQDYVHRIGRAGRAGRVGHALTFVEQRRNY